MAGLDFSLLGKPFSFGETLQYKQAAVDNQLAQRKQEQQAASDDALRAYAQDPSQIGRVIAANPTVGIALRKSDQDQARLDQTAKVADDERALKAKQSLTEALVHVPRERRAETLTNIAPYFPGVKPEDLTAITPHLDDDNFLRSLAGKYKEQQGYTLTPGAKRFDDNNREVAAVPFAPQYREVGEGQSLVEIPGGGTAPPSASPSITPQALTGILGGGTISSAARTPAHNAEVGGAPNSYHLRGQAADIVPPAGMTMAQAEAKLRNSGQQFAELINEGDHVHVAWGAPASGGARVIAQGAPKSTKEQGAPSGYRFQADGSLAPIAGGPADPAVKTNAGLKPIPPKIQQGYVENQAAISQIDQAIEQIRRNGSAMGLKNMAPEALTQRLDPGGIETRAAVANIGSKIIHDRSGAAVTASETPRLKPFIPDVRDTPEAAIKKLQGLRQQVINDTTGIELAYGEDSGYRPLSTRVGNASPSAGKAVTFARTPQQAQAATTLKLTGKGPIGAITNPVYLNPKDPDSSFGNVPKGGYFIGPDGRLKGPK